MGGNFILGIDPGLSGALAVYDPTTRNLIAAIDMPLHKPASKTATKSKSEIDVTALCFFLETHITALRLACIELVHAMPGQGVVSMFRFGQALGIIEGALGMFLLPTEKVSPGVWKSIMRLDSDKNKSRALATKLFPAHANLFCRKKDDGRAEAALLAVYGDMYCGRRR